jgi:NDP-sugar pyrophosphorylase family protein/thiamine kinase-like enzyme
MHKVIITTSGIGQRLGEHTRYTNKSLVKVGDKYAICYIIESYDKDTHFVITLGHYGNYVKDFLTMAYPECNIEYVYVDKYEGEGSSLGYSLLKSENLLQCPFIFHCCDAIVKSPIQIVSNKNTLYVSSHNSNAQYSSIVVANNIVKELNDKNNQSYDYVYTGITYIHNYVEFWRTLNNVYIANPRNGSLSDIHAIKQMMSQGIPFEYNILQDWYDTGNKTSYNKLKESFKPKYEVLEKLTESLCFIDNIVIKFINDENINTKRVLRGNALYPLTPKIHNSTSNFIKMELVDGVILSEVYQNGIIYNLLQWAREHLWLHSDKNDKYIDCCKRFYISKTIKRINELSFLKNEHSAINGMDCKNIQVLINSIPIELLCTDTFVQFHGDFILDNILLESTNEFKLIDWRHEFDDQLTHGDLYYDLAKLRHNLILNHKNINKGLFEIKYEDQENNVVVDLKCNYFHVKELEDYDRFIHENGYNMKKIKILTALIWLNMAPLYDGKFREFLFYFGKYNLACLL